LYSTGAASAKPGANGDLVPKLHKNATAKNATANDVGTTLEKDKSLTLAQTIVFIKLNSQKSGTTIKIQQELVQVQKMLRVDHAKDLIQFAKDRKQYMDNHFEVVKQKQDNNVNRNPLEGITGMQAAIDRRRNPILEDLNQNFEVLQIGHFSTLNFFASSLHIICLHGTEMHRSLVVWFVPSFTTTCCHQLLFDLFARVLYT
jgi:hypothetical protein